MITRCFSVLLGCFLAGCATRPAGVAGYLLPETVQVGLTAPNLINGPVASATRQVSAAHSPLGQIGGTLTGTWRILPIRIERTEPQPVRVVPPLPTPLPAYRAGAPQIPMPAPTPKL